MLIFLLFVSAEVLFGGASSLWVSLIDLWKSFKKSFKTPELRKKKIEFDQFT